MSCDVTFDELAACGCGDLSDERQAEIREHLARCSQCRRRLGALEKADAALVSLPPVHPAAGVVLAARRAVAEVTRPSAREIMTLEEVAEFLRVTAEEMDELAEQLPAFELAGRIRVRRSRLAEWIADRERQYRR